MRKLFTLLCFLSAPALFAGSDKPAAQTIVERLIENSTAAESSGAAEAFAYTRATEVLFLEENGEVEKQVSRVYTVTPAEGKPLVQLVQVNGKSIDPRNPEHKQWQSEAGDNARKIELNEELLGRYDFTLAGEELRLGRSTFVLNFEPKAEAPDGGGVFGKLLNEIAGTLWVDQEDYQLVRADVKLRKKVSFFGGIAGNLEHLTLELSRQRLAPGVWANSNSAIELAGRKLFSRMHLKAFENCLEFRKPDGMAAAH